MSDAAAQSLNHTDKAPLRIAVLAGGDSSERAVSLESGRCVAEALCQLGHHVDLHDPAAIEISQNVFRDYDVILPMVHGTGGEDGFLQLRLKRIAVPFVGSSPVASALTFDKIATRNRLLQNALPVAPGAGVHRQHPQTEIQAAVAVTNFPAVVKPCKEGSSVGVSIVRDQPELQVALDFAWRYSDVALIERYIPGREVTVAVVDGVALPVIEIIPANTWYDYAAKYEDDRTCYRVHPDNLPSDIVDISLQACTVCEVSGISRVDLRVTPQGCAYILEINTIPGMTTHSLVPMAAAAIGLSVGQLCEQVCRHAIRALCGAN